MAKKNPISHVEWRSKDATRLQKFYAAVFNWKFTPSGMPGYTMIDFGNKGTAGGIMQITPEMPAPAGLTNYANVEELAPHEEAIKANGGSVTMSKELPGIGWFSMFKDPDGNEFALWKQFVEPQTSKTAKKTDQKERKRRTRKRKRKRRSSLDLERRGEQVGGDSTAVFCRRAHVINRVNLTVE